MLKEELSGLTMTFTEFKTMWEGVISTIKEELSGLTMTFTEFKTMWEGVIRTIMKDDFARAFVRMLERCKKRI
jgi:hypothetical protein